MHYALSIQLDSKKKLGGTKSVVAAFLDGELDRDDLDEEFRRLAEEAKESL